MSKNLSTVLKDSISDVFSTMFFLVPELSAEMEEEARAQAANGWYQGWLEIATPQGSLVLYVWTPGDIANELAANIFACDPDDVSPDERVDAFKEMMNMVAGNVVTIIDVDSQWKMGLPQAKILDQGNMAGAASVAQWQLAFEVEGRPLLAGWGAAK